MAPPYLGNNNGNELSKQRLSKQTKVLLEIPCYVVSWDSKIPRDWIEFGRTSNIKRVTVQGRSQDFSVGTHSFPSHLFTPAPPPKKRSKSFSIHVSFISNRVRKSLNWMQINLFFCLLFLWVSMCERHCLSCESTTFCSSPFASIYVTYYKKQQCVHGFITPTDKNSI